MNDALVLNSLHLFKIAKLSYKRAAENADEMTRAQADSLVAVVFAAATLESFANEFGVLARQSRCDSMKEFADELDHMEDQHAATGLKFLKISDALGGSVYSKGARPFQDFKLLFDVRNAVVHVKPEFLGNVPKIMQRLATLGLCKIPNRMSGNISDYAQVFRDISTAKAAQWACKVVTEMVGKLRNSLPADDYEIAAFLANYEF